MECVEVDDVGMTGTCHAGGREGEKGGEWRWGCWRQRGETNQGRPGGKKVRERSIGLKNGV